MVNNAAEIIGKVQPDLTVKCFQATDFGQNFGTDFNVLLTWVCLQFFTDYEAANAVVECTHRYKKIFYDNADE